MSLSITSGSAAPPRWATRCGALAAAAGCGFLAWVVVLQFLRGDLSWTRAQLSLYLHGPYGLSLRVAYCLLAISMVLLAGALQAGVASAVRSTVVFWLFFAAALGLAAVAVGDSYLPQYAPEIALPVHLLSAQAAFVCVIAAILLQSWRFREDPRWQAHAPLAWWLGWIAFAVLFAHAVLRLGPRGLGQKGAIGLIVAWLVLAGLRLASAAGAAPAGGSRDNGPQSNREDS